MIEEVIKNKKKEDSEKSDKDPVLSEDKLIGKTHELVPEFANGKMTGREVLVTPELAKEILQTRNVVYNRPINEETVKYYSALMKRGYWKRNGEGAKFTPEGWMINGQHTFMAMVDADYTTELFFTYNVPEEAYDTLDQPRARTAADLFASNGIKYSHNKAALITKYFVLTKQDGDSKSSLKKKRIAKAEILTEYLEHEEFYEKVYDVADKCYQKKRLLTTTEIGGYSTFLIKEKNHEEEKVFDFFRHLVNIKDNTCKPIRLLFDKIINRSLSGYKLTNATKFAFIVKAWNAYLTNQEIEVLNFNEQKEKAPLFL